MIDITDRPLTLLVVVGFVLWLAARGGTLLGKR